ncbi:HIRAN domain-containing protein [Georgfuchsia toluolica]|nr:HIRAN domain-containing protein [Georgfuchsia toluolica]
MRSLLISLLALLCFNAQAQAIRLLVQSSPLAGFSHYDAAANFEAMKVGDVLTLVREADNPHDVNAVRVEWHGVKLGYLPRRENRAVAMEMDRGGKIEVRVACLRQHPNPRERLLIDVFAVL